MPRVCLVAEADPFIASLLRRFGMESGLRAVHTQVGQEIVQLARAIRPEVIFLDAELPGDTCGWEAAQALQRDRELRRIPVIVVSWLLEADARNLVGDAVSYLRKPDIHYADFRTALKQAGVTLGGRLADDGASAAAAGAAELGRR